MVKPGIPEFRPEFRPEFQNSLAVVLASSQPQTFSGALPPRHVYIERGFRLVPSVHLHIQ